jgi:hypothetical protein
MNIIIGVLFAIVILALCYLFFALGRVYECVVAIREIDEKIDELLKGGEG